MLVVWAFMLEVIVNFILEINSALPQRILSVCGLKSTVNISDLIIFQVFSQLISFLVLLLQQVFTVEIIQILVRKLFCMMSSYSLGPVYEYVCTSFRTDNINYFRAS